MDQRQATHDAVLREVRVEASELVGAQHALVHDRPRRKAGHVARRSREFGHRPHLAFDPLSNEVQCALERGAVVGVDVQRVARDEYLPNGRLGAARLDARELRVGGNVAPAEHATAIVRHDALDDGLAARARRCVARQKQHTDAVGASVGEPKAQRRALPPQKCVWNVEQYPRAVASVGIAENGRSFGR